MVIKTSYKVYTFASLLTPTASNLLNAITACFAPILRKMMPHFKFLSKLSAFNYGLEWR